MVGDPKLLSDLNIPLSTAKSWIRTEAKPVVTHPQLIGGQYPVLPS